MGRTERILRRVGLNHVPPVLRKGLIGVIGITIVLIGLLLIFLPGPGSLVIVAGIAVLATEFVWARQLIRRGRELARKVGESVKTAMKS